MKWLIGLLGAMLVLGLALASAASGAFQSNCLADEMLADADIVVVRDLSLSELSGIEVAENVAAKPENGGAAPAGGDLGELRDRRLSIIQKGGVDMNGAEPVFLFGVHHDGAPHPMFPGPVGFEATVTTPCSIVVVTPDGELLFTSTPRYIVE
jgi:hypothetical protein